MRSTQGSWDVIVVGAGLGGSVAALQLAEHGLSVLVLEAGAGPDINTPGTTDRSWWRPSRGAEVFAAPDAGPRRRTTIRLGTGPGGTSALYEAALCRLKRTDFAPAPPAVRSAAGEAPLPSDWPLDYDAFRAYYRRAEALMRVCGEPDPLDPDDDAKPIAPPPLSAVDGALRTRLALNGLHPYRLRVGFRYDPGCRECLGRRCLRDCKADGYSRALRPALATGRVTLESGVTVRTIERDPDGLLVAVATAAGATDTRRAPRVVVAAGALATPLILARSPGLWTDGTHPPMLGRGLMFHFSDKFVVAAPHARGSSGPRKALAFRDFYGDGKVELGEVHSTGARLGAGLIMSVLRERAGLTGPLRRRLIEPLRPLAWLVARALGPLPVLSTISEDLPYASNRVWEEPGTADTDPGAPTPILIAYTPDPHLRTRLTAMRSRLRAAFAPFRITFLSRPGTPNWGHPMGTCRMGTDPATSVVTPEGHLHEDDAVYIADASVFPSSGGAGPSLTIVAQALRVADAIAARLGNDARAAPRTVAAE
jgi:choline dehydrogenase-like flavoprotein